MSDLRLQPAFGTVADRQKKSGTRVSLGQFTKRQLPWEVLDAVVSLSRSPKSNEVTIEPRA